MNPEKCVREYAQRNFNEVYHCSTTCKNRDPFAHDLHTVTGGFTGLPVASGSHVWHGYQKRRDPTCV